MATTREGTIGKTNANTAAWAPTQPAKTLETCFTPLAEPIALALRPEFERLCTRLGLPTDPDSNRIDDRYRIEQTLGRGAMGVVYRAWDERLGRRVAIKLVRVRVGTSVAPLQARLEREAQMLARVDHRNVISIYDVGSHEARVYLAMQYVAGVTLRDWQQAKPRSLSELLDVYLQAAHGLAAAHAGAVIHRDFKPDNVIVGDDGVVRVLDFGISAALQTPETEITLPADPEQSSDSGTRTALTASDELAPLTRTGAILGTPAYMAPEQLRAGDVDAHSDQFAFCVALWEALAGQRPFDLHGSLRSPRDYAIAIEQHRLDARALPGWLRPILTKGLSQDPSARFASMAQLITALQRGRKRRRQLAWTGVATLALAPAVLAGSLLAPPSERESCDAFVAQVELAWGDEERAALERFADADLRAVSYARTTLDALSEGWSTRARTHCDGEFAPPHDEPSRVCLQTWLTSLERNVALLTERGDLQTLVRAPELLSVLSNSGDFCEQAPTLPVDPELSRLAQAAREAAWIGDLAGAESLAAHALERANQQLDGRKHSPELAEAHAARATVWMSARDYDQAQAQFAIAERHAIGTGYWSVLLPTYTQWSKAVVLAGHDAAPELAGGHLERALPLADLIALAPTDLRRIELIETRGLIAREAGRKAEAIEHHQRARALFMAAHQPVRAAKSLTNIGANQLELGELELAGEAYREALDLLTKVGVSERHPNLLDVEFNLGQLAMVSYDATGLRHLLHVAELYPDPIWRIEALNMASNLAHGTEQPDLAVELAERALAELATATDAPARLRVDVELVAGICLATKGDPRGERLVLAAERRAKALPAEVQLMVAQSWITWLEDHDRCADARARFEALDAAMQTYDASDFNYSNWHLDQTEPLCHYPTGE